jgi:hypothetical protein
VFGAKVMDIVPFPTPEPLPNVIQGEELDAVQLQVEALAETATVVVTPALATVAEVSAEEKIAPEKE